MARAGGSVSASTAATASASAVKEQICDVGRRLYARGFAAANDGNITARIGGDEVLCTPTMHCKGFLEPDDIATIDMPRGVGARWTIAT